MMILMIMVMMVGLMQPMTETMMLKGLMQPMTDVKELYMVMVLTATMAMTAMTTTMTMKMHPFYPKPTNTQLIAYKPFLRTVPIQPRPIQPMTSSMWADSADGIVDVG